LTCDDVTVLEKLEAAFDEISNSQMQLMVTEKYKQHYGVLEDPPVYTKEDHDWIAHPESEEILTRFFEGMISVPPGLIIAVPPSSYLISGPKPIKSNAARLQREDLDDLDDHAQVLAGLICQGRNCILTGGAGVGKTTSLKREVAHLVKSGVKVVVLATTNAAVQQCKKRDVPNVYGTLHSFMGATMYTKSKEGLIKSTGWPTIKKRIQETGCLVLDEASICSFEFLIEIVHPVCCEAKGNDKPFGGIQVVLVCDLLQLPPVDGTTLVNSAEVLSSKFGFVTVVLQKVYRQKDPEVVSLLNKVRKGEFDQILLDEAVGSGAVSTFKEDFFQNFEVETFLNDENIDESIVIAGTWKNVNRVNLPCLLWFIKQSSPSRCATGNLRLKVKWTDMVSEPAAGIQLLKWSSHPSAVELLQKGLNALLVRPDQHRRANMSIFWLSEATDTSCAYDKPWTPQDTNDDVWNGTLDYSQEFAPGMRVMNNSKTKGHHTCPSGQRNYFMLDKGALGAVVSACSDDDGNLEVTILLHDLDCPCCGQKQVTIKAKDHKGENIHIYAKTDEDSDNVLICDVTFKYVDLLPAFAFSVHKSQGCQAKYVSVICSDFFENGQAYVACSRSELHLSLYEFDAACVKADPIALAFYEDAEATQTSLLRLLETLRQSNESLLDVIKLMFSTPVELPSMSHLAAASLTEVFKNDFQISCKVNPCLKNELTGMTNSLTASKRSVQYITVFDNGKLQKCVPQEPTPGVVYLIDLDQGGLSSPSSNKSTMPEGGTSSEDPKSDTVSHVLQHNAFDVDRTTRNMRRVNSSARAANPPLVVNWEGGQHDMEFMGTCAGGFRCTAPGCPGMKRISTKLEARTCAKHAGCEMFKCTCNTLLRFWVGKEAATGKNICVYIVYGDHSDHVAVMKKDCKMSEEVEAAIVGMCLHNPDVMGQRGTVKRLQMGACGGGMGITGFEQLSTDYPSVLLKKAIKKGLVLAHRRLLPDGVYDMTPMNALKALQGAEVSNSDQLPSYIRRLWDSRKEGCQDHVGAVLLMSSFASHLLFNQDESCCALQIDTTWNVGGCSKFNEFGVFVYDRASRSKCTLARVVFDNTRGSQFAESETCVYEFMMAINDVILEDVGERMPWWDASRVVSIGVDAHQGQLNGLRKFLEEVCANTDARDELGNQIEGADVFDELIRNCQVHFMRALFKALHKDGVYKLMEDDVAEDPDQPESLKCAVSTMWDVVKRCCSDTYLGSSDDCFKELVAMYKEVEAAVTVAIKGKCHILNTLKFYIGSFSANGSKGYREQLFPVMKKQQDRTLKQKAESFARQGNSGWNTNAKEISHQVAADVRSSNDKLVMCIVKTRGMDQQQAREVMNFRQNPCYSAGWLGCDDGRRSMAGILAKGQARVDRRRLLRAQNTPGQRKVTPGQSGSKRPNGTPAQPVDKRSRSISPASPLVAFATELDTTQPYDSPGHKNKKRPRSKSPASRCTFTVGDTVECEWSMQHTDGTPAPPTWYPGKVTKTHRKDGQAFLTVEYSKDEHHEHDARNCRIVTA